LIVSNIVSQILVLTYYQQCSMSGSRTTVRCPQENLPSSSLPCCTPSPAHATTAAVVVVADATIALPCPCTRVATTIASATPRSRVLERPPSPSPDRLAYQPMEPSDLDASSWDHRGWPCAIHGWGPCLNRDALAHKPSSSGRQGRQREKKKAKPIGSWWSPALFKHR
jgi:hypothetical protein